MERSKSTLWLKAALKRSKPPLIIARPEPVTAPSKIRLEPSPSALRMPLLAIGLSTASEPGVMPSSPGAPSAVIRPALTMVLVPVSMVSRPPLASRNPCASLIRVRRPPPSVPWPLIRLSTSVSTAALDAPTIC